MKTFYGSLARIFLSLLIVLQLSSCAGYRIATNSQEGTEYQYVKGKSLFWGLVANPPLISTPICDSLQSLGMSEVKIKRNTGQGLVSIVTLGIYNPITIAYKCSKPCAKTSDPL